MSESQGENVQCPLVVLRITKPQIMGDLLADVIRDDFLTLYKQTGAVHVVIDMADVEYLSSAGIRPLLALTREVREREGRLILSGLRDDVESVFVASRLVSTNPTVAATFEHATDVPAAVAHLYETARPLAP